MITFVYDGAAGDVTKIIPGTSSQPTPGSFDNIVQRRKPANTSGELEIRGGRGGRNIVVTTWVHHPTQFTTFNLLSEFLHNDLADLVNEHGIVTVTTAGSDLVYGAVTMERWVPKMLHPDGSMVLIPDIAGCLEPTATGPVFWTEIEVHFRQL